MWRIHDHYLGWKEVVLPLSKKTIFDAHIKESGGNAVSPRNIIPNSTSWEINLSQST